MQAAIPRWLFTALALLVGIAGAQEVSRPIALVGGAVIDGTSAPRREAVTVILEGGRIAAVGTDAEVPDGAEVVDVAGKTLIPGLVDMHGHYYGNVGGGIVDLFEPYARLYLAGGVTTTFSPGDHDPQGMIELRRRVREGEVPGPRILTAGPYLDHAPSAVGWIEGIDGADAAVAKFQRWRERIDGVKVYTSITEAELEALVAAAHGAGMRVTGHLGSITAARAIELGIDRLEHGLFAMSEFGRPGKDPYDLEYYRRLAAVDLGGAQVESLIAAIVEHGVVIDPTIVVLQASVAQLEPVTPHAGRYIAPETAAWWERFDRMRERMVARHGDAWTEAVRGALDKAIGFAVAVHRAGGIVVTGTDPVAVVVLPGWGLHRELANFVAGGMTPLEALRCGSYHAALALGLEDELGTLEPGKRADVVVVDGDPAVDITALARIETVFRDGLRFDAAELRKGAEGAIR